MFSPCPACGGSGTAGTPLAGHAGMLLRPCGPCRGTGAPLPHGPPLQSGPAVSAACAKDDALFWLPYVLVLLAIAGALSRYARESGGSKPEIAWSPPDSGPAPHLQKAFDAVNARLTAYDFERTQEVAEAFVATAERWNADGDDPPTPEQRREQLRAIAAAIRSLTARREALTRLLQSELGEETAQRVAAARMQCQLHINRLNALRTVVAAGE